MSVLGYYNNTNISRKAKRYDSDFGRSKSPSLLSRIKDKLQKINDSILAEENKNLVSIVGFFGGALLLVIGLVIYAIYELKGLFIFTTSVYLLLSILLVLAYQIKKKKKKHHLYHND